VSPERTCVGCRGRSPQSQLLRFVLRDGVLVQGRRLPGRGAWLHASPDCLRLALRRNAFGRALRTTGPIDVTAVAAGLGGPDASAGAV